MQDDGSISPVKAFFKNRWVIGILIVDALAVIVVIGFIIWNSTKTATINFSIAPVDAKIQIDGQGEYYNGSYQVHPGNHTITISHDSLETKTFEMDLKSGYNTTLTAFLKGASTEPDADSNSSASGSVNDPAFNFYTLRNNYDSFQKLAAIASEGNNLTTDQDPSAYQFIKNFQHAYNLWQNELPINYVKRDEKGFLLEDLTIRAKSDCQSILCVEALMVGVNGDGLVASLLQEKGINAEDYEIIYKRY